MMKKIIALALALSMALSMVAFAGYTDADLINADLTDDIELVKALGLMTGNPDGSFNPQGTLTRAEAAVIVCRLSAVKSDIDDSWADADLNTFTDMADHWAAKYVNYCAALGLINGYPDGTYRPENPVTAVEMAKMLLNAAGYDSDKQGYTNPAKWPASALADATNAGLFADFDAAFTGKASREWVAKLVSNLILKVQTVGYSQLTGALVKNTVGTSTTPSIFGTEKYEIKISDPILVLANDTWHLAALSANAAKDKAYVGTTDANKILIKADVANELVGHEVTVYYKGTSLSSTSEIYAVADAAEQVIETTMDQVTVDGAKLYVGEEQITDEMTNLWALVSGEFDNTVSFGKTAKNDKRPVTLVKNSNDDWRIFYNGIAYGQVSKIEANKTFSVSGLGNLVTGSTTADKTASYAKINCVNAVAKDDYVMVEKLIGGGYNVTKLNPTRTKMTGVQVTDGTFSIGSTVYEAAEEVMYDWTMTSAVDALNAAGGLKAEYDLYTVDGYVVFVKAVTKAAATGLNMDIALLLNGKKAASSTATAFDAADTDKVQVLFADGSFAVYEYKVPTTGAETNAVTSATLFSGVANGATLGAGAIDKIYAYVLNDDGTIYFTTNLTNDSKGSAAADGGAYTYNEDKSYMAVDTDKLFITADTFFFVKMKNTSGEWIYDVVNASEIKDDVADSATKAYGALSASTGLKNLVYGLLVIDDTDLPAQVATVAGDYFILTKALTENKALVGDKEVTTWTATGINNKGEVVTLELDSKTVYTAAEDTEAAIETLGQMFVVTTVGDKTVLADFNDTVNASSMAITDAGWYAGVVTASSDSWIQLDIDTNGALIDLADDAVMFRVTKRTDENTFSVASVTSVPRKTASTTATGGYTNNVTVLVKIDKVGDELVVTDVILASTKASSTATAATQNYDVVIK